MGGGTCGLSFTSHTPSDIRDPEQRRHCFHAAVMEGMDGSGETGVKGGEEGSTGPWGGALVG